MSTLPRDIRIQTLHDIGVKIDDSLESARNEKFRREGARTAHYEIIKQLSSLISKENKESDNKVVEYCVKVVDKLASQATAMFHASLGAENQAKAHVELIKKVYDLELVLKNREEVPLPVEVSPEIASRPVPSRTLKEQRLALVNSQQNQKVELPAAPAEEAVMPVVADDKPAEKKARSKKTKSNVVETKIIANPDPIVEIEIDTTELEEKKEIKKKSKRKLANHS